MSLKWLIFLTFCLPALPLHASASEPMAYIYDAPESADDTRYLYHWKILRAALEKTRARYGPYTLSPSLPMPESRQVDELISASGKLTVMYLGTRPEFERQLEPVRIPVDRNLGGYSVFLIRKDEESKFKNLRRLEDLKPFSFGLGLGWLDVEILQHSGFKVVTGSSYDGLFEMLENRRFDIFLRAVPEVLGELEEHKAAMPDLEIEPSCILYYTLPMYFWFSKTTEGKRLAKRARDGMFQMIADGSFKRIFNRFQKAKIETLHLGQRRIFKIPNPLLGPETPFDDKRLWFELSPSSGKGS